MIPTDVSLLQQGQRALEANRFADAERLFRQVLVGQPNSVDALRGLGYALFQMNQLAEALATLDDALRRAPGDLLVRLLLGRLCLRLQEPDAAEKHFRRILKKIPTSEPARSGLVDAAIARDRLDEAKRIAGQIVALNPRSELGLFAAARIAEMQADYDVARAHYDRLIAVAPDNANHRYNRARILLHSGEFEEGWREYEFRFASGAVQLPAIHSPRWTGAPTGHLLLVAEQGLGDTIQFARFIPQAKLLARKTTVACQRSLAGLLQRSFSIDTTELEGNHWPDHDAHLPMMSLPHVLGLGAQTLRPIGPYVLPDPALRHAWAHRLALSPDRLNVGIVSAASAVHATEQRPQTRRSCDAEDLAPLGGIAELEIFDLQVGAPNPGHAGGPTWRTLPAGISDFDDTAAIIDSLDLLVSVDTAAAHIGGALDKAVALLLPYAADWRWMRDVDRSGWYRSVRPVRQTSPGDWSGAVGSVKDLLTGLAAEKRLKSNNNRE